ncbi:hypothetical protein A2U01_0000342 [Trifolium medium]|uniref:Uncharacterized protein n=1 Tax=Trifolium medium TaxID=97028 RepID=A0A392LXB0_9FABA|nr:hypothetical protein [Trifolium medium]
MPRNMFEHDLHSKKSFSERALNYLTSVIDSSKQMLFNTTIASLAVTTCYYGRIRNAMNTTASYPPHEGTQQSPTSQVDGLLETTMNTASLEGTLPHLSQVDGLIYAE